MPSNLAKYKEPSPGVLRLTETTSCQASSITIAAASLKRSRDEVNENRFATKVPRRSSKCNSQSFPNAYTSTYFSSGPMLLAMPISSHTMMIPQQVITVPCLVPSWQIVHTPTEPLYCLPRGDNRTPLNPAILPGLGRGKISRLKQLGIKTIETLATVNAYNLPLARDATNNCNSRHACTTLLAWRNRARAYLESNCEKQQEDPERPFII